MTAGPGANTAPGCLHVAVPEQLDPDLVADRAWLLGATAVGELTGSRLEIGFGCDDDAVAAAAALGEWWPELGIAVVDAAPALQAALEAWRPHARPLRVGRLHVRPAFLDHEDDPPAAGERLVVVDPTLAFGYDHPSTRLCLEQLEQRAGPGRSVLDVGCGSGVLAVSAAVLGAGPVVAIDIDPVAVAATRSAAERNGVDVAVADTPLESVEGQFDLVVANIGARTLVAMAPVLGPRVAAEGMLVLAGLLVDQVDEVVAAYEVQGLIAAATGESIGWAAPVFLGFPAAIHHAGRSVPHTVGPQEHLPPPIKGAPQ